MRFDFAKPLTIEVSKADLRERPAILVDVTGIEPVSETSNYLRLYHNSNILAFGMSKDDCSLTPVTQRFSSTTLFAWKETTKEQ